MCKCEVRPVGPTIHSFIRSARSFLVACLKSPASNNYVIVLLAMENPLPLIPMEDSLSEKSRLTLKPRRSTRTSAISLETTSIFLRIASSMEKKTITPLVSNHHHRFFSFPGTTASAKVSFATPVNDDIPCAPSVSVPCCKPSMQRMHRLEKNTSFTPIKNTGLEKSWHLIERSKFENLSPAFHAGSLPLFPTLETPRLDARLPRLTQRKCKRGPLSLTASK